MSSVPPIHQKHGQMGSQLIQPTWIMILLYVVPFYYVLYPFRNEYDNTHNHSTQEVETGESQVQDQPSYMKKSPDKIKQNKKNEHASKHTGSREELHTRLKMRIWTLSVFLM